LKVGFIGLGLMGRLMAANLEKAGYSIQSFDLNGSGNCRSAREAAAGAEVLITMVPDGKAVRKAVLAALPGLAAGCIVIDMSSSDPSDTKKLNEILKKTNIHLLDAPVSGARAKAADGTLALLVGEKFGLDPKILIDVINASTGKNSTTERKIPQQVFTGAFASGFQLALMTKDVGIARELARAVGVETPYLKSTLKIWRDALNRLPAGADHTEMYRYLKQLKSPSRGAASRPARSRRKRRRST
jgi:3-hydroxyisobutyrate dehydrogenase